MQQSVKKLKERLEEHGITSHGLIPFCQRTTSVAIARKKHVYISFELWRILNYQWANLALFLLQIIININSKKHHTFV
jgi:hypothetical protein